PRQHSVEQRVVFDLFSDMPPPPLLKQLPLSLVCFTKCFPVFFWHARERRRVGSDAITGVTWRASLNKQGIEARLDLIATLGAVGDFVLTGLPGFALERGRHRDNLLDPDFQRVHVNPVGTPRPLPENRLGAEPQPHAAGLAYPRSVPGSAPHTTSAP